MMTVNQAIDCVRSDWNVTCPVGQKQAALALMNEVVWLRLQFAAIQGIVNNGELLNRGEHSFLAVTENDDVDSYDEVNHLQRRSKELLDTSKPQKKR